MNAWNVVVVGNALAVVRLATGGRARYENLDWVQALAAVKFFIQHPNVFEDALFAVPRELQLLRELLCFLPRILWQLPILEGV